MLNALANRMLDRGVLRRAGKLSDAERSRYLHRTDFAFTCCAALSVFYALGSFFLALYMIHLGFALPTMPEVLSVSWPFLYSLTFAFLALLFTFLAALGFRMRRLLRPAAF